MPQKRPSGRSYNRFSLQDYQGNPEAVKKANDAAMDYLETELGNIDRLRNENLLLKSENLLLKERMHANRRFPIFQAFFALLGGVLITLGAGGFVTSSPGFSVFSSSGLLLGIGIVVSLFGVFASLITRSRRGNS